MFTKRRIVFTCAFLLAIVAVIWSAKQTVVPQQHGDTVAPQSLENVSTESAIPAARPTSRVVEQIANDCLKPQQLESHPLISAEFLRLAPISSNGPAMEVYRGLSRTELKSLAEQNDSGAMAVLGAMALFRAKDLDERSALDYLQISGSDALRTYSGAKFGENAKAENRQAYDWFYQAAMHGRIYALTYAGEALSYIEPNPIEHGLITPEEYELLTRSQLSLLNLTTIFSMASVQIERNSDDHSLELTSKNESAANWLARSGAKTALKFRADVKAANLPPVVIPESALPEGDELGKLLCEEYRLD